MKVFISQPMRNRTVEEISQERKDILKLIKKKLPNNTIELLDTYFKESKSDNPLYNLGKAIQFMGKADLVFFADDWEFYKGCCIERTIAELYNIPMLDSFEDKPYRINENIIFEYCEVTEQ